MPLLTMKARAFCRHSWANPLPVTPETGSTRTLVCGMKTEITYFSMKLIVLVCLSWLTTSSPVCSRMLGACKHYLVLMLMPINALVYITHHLGQRGHRTT